MKHAHSWLWFWRTVAGVLLVTYSVACTHLPSGEKAFDSFESCFAANLGLAAVGGVAVGVVGAHLTQQMTGNASTGKKVGAVAGIAAAAMIAMTAWRKCGAVYNKSEPVRPAAEPRPQPATSAPQKPRLTLDRLDIRVDGTENDPPVPEFDFSFFAENPAAKDIKAKFRHKVEIVRFKAGDDDKLILADEKGDAMLDKAGKEIPLAAAIRMPRERLHWVSIAEEGKDDYVEDVVIQQGQRTSYRHKLQIPPRAQLPLPLPVPMRYTLSVEADQMKTARVVDFAILGTGERPKRYGSRVYTDVGAGQSGAAAASSTSAAQGYATKRTATLFSDATPARKKVATLKKGTTVRIEDRAQATTTNNKQVEWVKVITDDGTTGWLPANQLSRSK